LMNEFKTRLDPNSSSSLKLHWNSHLDHETVGPHWSPLYGENPGMFSSKQLKKERHGHLGWHGGE